jgi:hypothetical protein
MLASPTCLPFRQLPCQLLGRWSVLALSILSVQCGGGDGGGPGPGGPTPIPTSIAILGGNNQTGVVGEALPTSPSVVVSDAGGNGLAGVTVTFSIPFGGGSLTGATPRTGADGIAVLGEWVLGTGVGSKALRAEVTGVNPVQFSASAVAGAADSLVGDSPLSQVTPAGSMVPVPPRVIVVDRYGNPVGGVQVNFAVTEGGGSIPVEADTTSVLGQASLASWRVGIPLGTNTVVGPPASVVKVSGDNQTAPAGTVLPENPTIQVRDAVGHPVPGAYVQLGAYSGTVNTSQFTADTNGMVEVIWRFRGQGQNFLEIGSECCKVTFTGTSVAGPPAVLMPFGTGQSGVVGTPLQNPIGFRVEDLGGNALPGIPVTFAPVPGSGSVTGAKDTTDSQGNAFVGSWRLGTTYALDSLRGSTPSGIFAYVEAQTIPGPAASLIHQAGNNQVVGAGLSVPVIPVVKAVDQYGNDAWYVRVLFQIQSGNGSVLNSAVTTDVDGIATSGGWTLGLIPGPNTLRASVQGTSVAAVFTAQALPRPAQIVKHAGDLQTGLVGTSLPIDLTVRILDTQGAPLAGVPVDFSVASGGGSVAVVSDTSDVTGLASSGSWFLGTTSGTQTVAVSVAGINSAIFSASAAAGPPAAMSVAAGALQTQVVNLPVRTKPAVILRDQYNNPTPGVSVTFAVTAGGGQVVGPSAMTDETGFARVVDWILGPQAGGNELTATAPGGVSGSPVTFTATGLVSQYSIDIRPLSSLTPNQQIAFNNVRVRIERMIVGDVPNISLNMPAGFCAPSQPAFFNEPIDDVIIFAEVLAIDGPGGILGQAGPCAFRTPSYLPAVGIMRFDVADLNSLEGSGLLEAVILHEMQHVLGFGTNWSQLNKIFGAGSSDPYFIGSNARNAFNQVGGSGYAGNRVPLENTGGPGTRDGHWRESVFHSELMTGFVSQGVNPLSIVTVNAFLDVGYAVNEGAADDHIIGPFPSRGRIPAVRFVLQGDIWRGPQYMIEADGTLTRIGSP